MSDRSSAEIKLELEAGKTRVRELRDSITGHEDCIRANHAEISLLTGGYSSWKGKLTQLGFELERAVRKEEDAALPRVRVEPREHGDRFEYVLVKVTEKQIHLRKVGRVDVDKFAHDGTSRWTGTINAEDLAEILSRKGSKNAKA